MAQPGKLTVAGEDIVLAFGRQVGRPFVLLLGVLNRVGDVGQECIRVGELENIGRDDGIVIPAAVMGAGENH